MAGTSTLSSARRSRHAAGGASGAASRAVGDLAQRRGQLEARWRKTLERVTALSVAYHDAAAARPVGEDVARLGRRVVAERQALAEIEAALDRIAVGQYGRCEQCHRPISAGLLAAQPEARFCSACSRHSAHLAAGA
jgi:RNA polymerase-binding transcription factor DksA